MDNICTLGEHTVRYSASAPHSRSWPAPGEQLISRGPKDHDGHRLPSGGQVKYAWRVLEWAVCTAIWRGLFLCSPHTENGSGTTDLTIKRRKSPSSTVKSAGAILCIKQLCTSWPRALTLVPICVAALLFKRLQVLGYNISVCIRFGWATHRVQHLEKTVHTYMY
jgi:hypothetical protein